ncbi:MAG TPA: guanylate kinase [Pirellulaceae bacterium]|nr:guanylate kinase [Pirellulaceae bacterium]
MSPQLGKLVIISGPSGAGKSSVVRELLHTCQLPLRMSISATTRRPREGEQDGVHYHFLSREEFAHRRDAGEFLECKEVFGRGDWYGTLKSEVEAGFRDGCWMVLEIDVEGALSVLTERPDAISIFIDPGTHEELERRLRGRGTESDDAIRRRLEVAERELHEAHRYRYHVVNSTLPQAVQEICRILDQNNT